MNELILSSATFGVVISLLGYLVGLSVKKRFKAGVFNPLLIAIVLVVAVLKIFRIDYSSYNAGAKYLSYLLTPATVCLAVPLYMQIEKLRRNALAIFCALAAGVLTSLVSVLALSVLFRLSHQEYVTLLPKSITSPIGMGGAWRLSVHHSGGHYSDRNSRQCVWRSGLQAVPNNRTDCKRPCHGIGCPCHRHHPCHGMG